MTLMVLARAWRRRLYASLGMTVIVPMALLAALTVLALNGGIPGLGSLRQAVAGPAAAAAPPVLGGGLGGRRQVGPLLASSPGAVAPIGGSPAALGTSSGSAAGAMSGSHGAVAGPGSSGGGHGGGAGAGGGGYSGSSPPSGQRPSPRPTVVDRIVGTLTPVTSTLPPPVGPAVTRTLKTGGSVVDRVLHHLPGQ